LVIQGLPEPISLGIPHEERSASPPALILRSPAVIDQLFQRLTILSTQLELATELSSTLQAQHAVTQNTISVLKSNVTSLESLVMAQQSPPKPASPESSAAPQADSITDILDNYARNGPQNASDSPGLPSLAVLQRQQHGSMILV
jgi:hypothetical protein